MRLVKSRLVANGSRQQCENDDFERFFSSGMTPHSLRLVLGIAAAMRWTTRQADVSSAYIHAKLDVPVYIHPPVGYPFPVPKGHVLRLTRALYGLRQSGKLWADELSGFLATLGLERSPVDPSLYFRRGKDGKPTVLAAVYVDDLVVASCEPGAADEILDKLHKKYKLSSRGPVSKIVGINVTFDETRGEATLDQNELIDEVGAILDVQHGMKIPAPSGTHGPLQLEMPFRVMNGSSNMMKHVAADKLREVYRTTLGKLLFIATMTRPDIATTVSELASFAEKPTYAHLQALHDCTRYVCAHRWPIVVGGDGLRGWLADVDKGPARIPLYADASWRSTESLELSARTGFVICPPGLPLAWRSKDQKRTSDSAADAEISALLAGVFEAIWQALLLRSVGVVEKFFVDAYTDSDSARKPCTAPVPKPHKLTAAVAKLATIRQLIVDEQVLRLSRIAGTSNPADVFTKDLKGQGHTNCVVRLKFMKTD